MIDSHPASLFIKFSNPTEKSVQNLIWLSSAQHHFVAFFRKRTAHILICALISCFLGKNNLIATNRFSINPHSG
jgi:glycerol-3-phosphate O-acyltransferase